MTNIVVDRVHTTINHCRFVFCRNIDQRQLKRFFQCVTIAWHVDSSSVVCTLIDNGKVANQIMTLLPIVVKITFFSYAFFLLFFCFGFCLVFWSHYHHYHYPYHHHYHRSLSPLLKLSMLSISLLLIILSQYSRSSSCFLSLLLFYFHSQLFLSSSLFSHWWKPT